MVARIKSNIVREEHISLSVAMATYNGAEYILEQLDSIAKQDIGISELVICDDASQDGTVDLIKSFSRNSDFPIRLHVNETRLGYARNFFRAISLCQGDVVLMSDQDDIWLPGKCSAIRSCFVDQAVDVVNHDYSVWFSDVGHERPSYFEYMATQGYPRCANIKGCSTAFRRSAVPISSLINLSPIPHDYAICLIGSALGSRKYINTPLMRHRIHGNNTSGFLFKSPLGLDAKVKAALTLPRSEAEELEYLLWIGANGSNFAAVEQILSNIDSPTTRAGAATIYGALETSRNATGAAYVAHSSRLRMVFGALLRGMYVGRGWQIGFLKDLAGRRGAKPGAA